MARLTKNLHGSFIHAAHPESGDPTCRSSLAVVPWKTEALAAGRHSVAGLGAYLALSIAIDAVKDMYDAGAVTTDHDVLVVGATLAQLVRQARQAGVSCEVPS